MEQLSTMLNEALYGGDYQYVFVVCKPGSLEHSQDIIKLCEKYGWSIHMTTTKQLLLSEAKRLYEVHKKEDFYKDLCNYMASGPSRAFIFKRRTKHSNPFKAMAKIKDVIRNKYGKSDMENVMHSSDNNENMQKEGGVYFGIVPFNYENINSNTK